MKEKIISHKKQIILIALAVVVLFCLWYTRPKSWSDLTEGYGTIREIKSSASIREYDSTWGHMVSRSYVLNVDSDAPCAAGLLEILENNSYRPMLRTLFPTTSLEGGKEKNSQIWASILTVSLIYGEDVLSLHVMGDRIAVSTFPDGNGLRGYIIQDGSLSDALAIFIRDNGVVESEYHPSSG